MQFISYQENIDTSSPLGQALFTIVSAVAQLERDLIRERVKAGLRNAKLKGRTLGRPRRIVSSDEMQQSTMRYLAKAQTHVVKAKVDAVQWKKKPPAKVNLGKSTVPLETKLVWSEE